MSKVVHNMFQDSHIYETVNLKVISRETDLASWNRLDYTIFRHESRDTITRRGIRIGDFFIISANNNV